MFNDNQFLYFTEMIKDGPIQATISAWLLMLYGPHEYIQYIGAFYFTMIFILNMHIWYDNHKKEKAEK